MAKITSQEQLKTYILRALGHPVICVELAPEQIEDRIADGIERYFERHYDGIDERVFILNVQRGVQDYTLPDEIMAVTKAYRVTNYLNTEPLLKQEPFITSNYSTIQGWVDIPQFEIWLQSHQMIETYFDSSPLYDFNGNTKKLHFFKAPEENTKVAFRTYYSTEGETNIFGNWWLRQYCVALCGIQWAVNISKYSGAPLPGGADLNYGDIENRYKEMKEQLEEQLMSEFSEPAEFGWG